MMDEFDPIGWKSRNTLNPKIAGKDRMLRAIQFPHTARFLLTFLSSIVMETIFSNTAIIVDIAANDINTKNRVPQILPFTIWLNTLGNVMKRRDGPASGWMLNAKHAGIIINPAVSATKVSKNTILRDSLASFRSFVK